LFSLRSRRQHKAWGVSPRKNVISNASPRSGRQPSEIMPDSYTNLLYRIVFSTKDRRPIITPEYEVRLYDYIGGTIRSLGGISLELNGTEDHVHLLAKLRPDRALSDVLRDLKANATGWMHDVFPSLKNFSWQRGYGAFTVSQSNVEDVRRYIARQKEHHQKVTFRDEFINFLRMNRIEHDKRFI
jgi:putative transposase